MIFSCQKKPKYCHFTGFSLFEVLITISLLSFIITIVISSSTFIQRQLVRSEVEKLYTTCMYLQRLAMMINKKQVLSFDVHGNNYSYGNHKEQLGSNVIFGTITNLTGPPSAPSSAITHPITFTGNQITFTPNGILQPGTVYLTDKNKNYQYALTVPVSQVSFLRKYSYSEKWNYLQ